MIAGPKRLAIAGMAILAACVGPSDEVVVKIPEHQALEGVSALQEVASTTVEIGKFSQPVGTGVLPGRIGERKTVGDISLGMVTIEPPPAPLIREAFAAELEAAGHQEVGSEGAALIEGEVQQFNLRTDVTAVYWDVVVDAAISTTVSTKVGTQTSKYSTSCEERTYTWPGDDVIARVVSTCVDNLSDQFRNDEAIAKLLASNS